jgi:serine/threonine-protein kinase
VQRFFNEARAATSIADGGIVQIFDFGHHTDGTAYIVMEMLDGESLERRLHRQGSLALGDVLRLMRQIASSLGAAHARGIVHRDLKPDNIFIIPDSEVAGGERTKLLDFGIAKLSGELAGVKTQTSAVMGTPMFMSPEQCRGAGLVDGRSDVYSLGCVMFLLLAGRPPFVAEGAGELIILHVCEPPPRLAQLVPGLPPAVDALVARCLAKDPAERPASGAVLAAELGALIEQIPELASSVRSMSGLPRVGPSTTPTTLSSSSAEVASTATPPARRRGWMLGAAGAAVAAVAVIAVIAVVNGRASGGAAAIVPTPLAAPAALVVPTATPTRSSAPPLPVPDPAPAPILVAPAPAPIPAPPPAAKPRVHHAAPFAAAPAPSTSPTTVTPPPPALPSPAVELAPMPAHADEDFKKRIDEQRRRAAHPIKVKPVE